MSCLAPTAPRANDKKKRKCRVGNDVGNPRGGSVVKRKMVGAACSLSRWFAKDRACEK